MRSKSLEEQVKTLSQENTTLKKELVVAKEATQSKSEFMAQMSHDLRTPLNGIIGFTQLLHNQKIGPLNQKQIEYLGDILSNAEMLLQLINDIIDLAKIEAGKTVFSPEKIDLEKIFSEIQTLFKAAMEKKENTLQMVCDDDLKNLYLDPAKLKQILHNLISNALKFTDKGTIFVRAYPKDKNNFCIEVKDSGIGIQEKDIGKLFHPFNRLRNNNSPGTGLGLVSTLRLVHAQGGNIEVRSLFGKGSTFSVTLPRKYPKDALK